MKVEIFINGVEYKPQEKDVVPEQPITKDRIEVRGLHRSGGGISDIHGTPLHRYEFNTELPISGDKFPEIKNLLERYLNVEMYNPAPPQLSTDSEEALLNDEQIKELAYKYYGKLKLGVLFGEDSKQINEDIDKRVFDFYAGYKTALGQPIPNKSFQPLQSLPENTLNKKQSVDTGKVVIDNSDVACLSLNDLLSVWGDGYAYNHKQSPMYKKFEKLVNQKLKQP